MGASSFGRRRYLFAYATLFLGVVFGCLLFFSRSIDVKAATGINEQINFQGRLYNSQGATVPDGIYNIQFKIYQDGDGQTAGDTTGSPAGSLKWTESHLVNNSQGVTVKNGFLSVELGSVTAFGSSIDWNQDTLWLSMNVGSTNPTCTPFSSCTPDGEMIPMKRFTANAYALNAKYLGGLSSSQFVQLQSSTPGTQQTGNINVSGTVIAGTQLQTPAILAPGALSIQATGTNTLTINTTGAGTLNLATTNTTTVALGNTSATLTVEGSTISVGNGASNHTIQIGTSSSGDNDISVGSSNTGSTLVLEGGTAASAIQIGNGATAHGVQIATNATGDNDVAIGGTNTGSTLTLEAGTSSTSIQIGNGATNHGIQIGSNSGGDNDLVVGSVNAGSTTLIQGGNSSTAINLQTAASGNINIGTNAVTGKVLNVGSVGTTANDTTLHIADSTGNAVQTVSIGSNANATSVTTIQGGSTGGINIGSVGSTTTSSTVHIADTSNGTGTQAVTIGSAGNVANSLLLQAGSTGKITLNGKTDVNNSVATKKGTDFSTTGTSADVDFGDTSLVRLTGATAQTINSIANGRDGYRLTIVNASAGSLDATLANETGSTAANRIRTGTGSALNVPYDSSVSLVYDSGASRWRVEGASAVAGSFIRQVPATTAENTIAPTANSVVGLTVKGTTGTAAHVLDIYNSNASPTLQGFFDANGSLNVSQVIQPTANNTIDLGLSGTTFRTVYAGTSVVTPLVDTLVGLSLGTGSATSVGIGRTGITTTNNGALTVVQLLTGQLGATVSGATISLNENSNFATNINSGSSTGAVAIGNNGNAANTISLDAGTGVSAIQIGNTNTAHGIKIGNNNTGDNDIAIGGTNTGSTIVLESGTASTAIQIGNGASDHGIQIGTNAGGANAVIIGSVNAASTTLVQGGNTSSAITLQTAASGSINIGTNAVAGKVINVGSVGSTANTSTVNIANTSGNATQTVNIGSTGNTSNAVNIESGTGSTAIQIGNGAAAHGIQIGSSSSGDNDILLGSSNAGSTLVLEGGTTSTAIQIGNGATQHGIQIGTNATGSSTVAIGSSNAGSTLNFEAGTAANAIQIGNSASVHGIQIGTGGAVQTIVIGSVNTTSATSIQGGATGAINIGTVAAAAPDSTTNIATTSNAAGTQTVNIGSSAKAANVVNVQAGTTGGINVGTVGTGTAGSTIHIADTSNGTGTQAVTIGSAGNVANSLLLQAGSTGKITLNGKTDVNNSVATKKGTDFSTTGTSADVDFGDTSLVRLTGATAQTINSIANGRDGYVLTIVNASTGSLPATIANETGTTAANRIRTGTGSAITLPFDGSITLVYDSGASRWRVEGAASTAGGYIKQVPATTAENTIAPTANSVVGLTVKGTTGTAAHVLDIYNSNASPTLQGFFDANGSLNVSQVIQPTANNTIDLGLSGTTFRTVYAGTSVVTPLVDTLVGLSLGTGSATSVGIGRTGITTTNNGALTVVQLLTGQLGATVSGATISLNENSNFATNINSGSSTGAVAIGNNGNAANTISLDAGTGVSAIQIGNTNTAHGIKIGNNNTGDNDIAIGGTNTGSTIVLESGTASTAIQIGNGASDHGIQIGTNAGGANAVIIGSVNAASTTLVQGGTSTSAINLEAGAGGNINIGANAVTGKVINIGSVGSTANATAVHIADTTANADQDVSIGGAGNTGSSVNIEAGTAANAIQIGNSGSNHGIQIGSSSSGDNDILIGGANAGSTVNIEGGTAAGAIQIGNGATQHGVQIATNATGSSTVAIGSTNAGSTLNFEAGTAANAIQIGNSASVHGIQIGTGGAVQTIVIGSVNTTSATSIQGGATGAINIGTVAAAAPDSTTNIATTSNAAGTQTVNIGSSAKAANVVNVQAGTTGGINVGTVGTGTAGSTIHIADTSNGTGTQAVTIGSAGNVANSLLLQAGSTGKITLNGKTDVNNSVATKKGTDFSTTGTSADVDFGDTSLVRLTGATAQTINSIANGRDGYVLTIVNASTGSLPATIANETGTTAANRIRTGTGAAVTLPFDASITLIYDSGASRWRMQGSVTATGGYIKQVPATTAENTIAPTANSVVGLTVKGTTGTAAHVLDIYNSNASPTLQGFFDANGSLNVSQVIQPTANNTIDLGLSGTTFRTVYAGTSVVTPLVDTLVGLSLGTGSATSVGIGRTGITTTNNGALTVVQLLTGQLGATVSGATISLNENSNFATNINSGSSTGAVAIGNNGNAANTISLDAGTGVSAIQIGNTNTAHGIKIGNNNTGDNDIAIGGTNTGSTIVLESGTASTAIQIGNGASDHGIQIGTGAAVQTVVIGSTNTTSATSIQGGTGGNINVGSVGTSTLSSTTNIANTSNATGTQIVRVGSSANTNNTFTLEAGTAASAIQIGNGATAHGIQIGSSNSADNDILIGGTNAGSTVIFEGGTAAAAIAIGNGNTAHGIQIGTNAGGDNDILIGGTNAGSTTTLQGGTSSTVAISLQAAAGGGISIGTTNNNPIIIGGTGTTSQITIGQSNAANTNTISIGSNIGNTGTQTINIGTSATAGGTTNVTLGSTNAGTILLQGATQITNRTSGSADTLVVSNNTSSGTIALFKDNATTVFSIADNGLALFKPQTNATSAFMIQPSGSTTPVLNADTTNSRIGLNTATPQATLEINSTVANTSGIRFTQLTSASTGGTSFTGILGLDTNGNVGLSQASVSLTSPALAFWDGINNPTTGSQSYPLATLSGNAAYVGGGNGVRLTSNTNNVNGSMNWTFSQVPFEETQFQFKAGGGTGADGTWFYSYADVTPTSEYGAGGITKGYIIYFSEWHDCIGISYGAYNDGNQCGSGGGTNPLTSVSMPTGTIDDNNFHDVDIQILLNRIIVRWDGRVLIDYSDVYTRDTSSLNFGFGSRTGGSNNNHYIKGLLVTKLGTNTSQYYVDDTSPLASGLNWKNSSSSTGSLGVGLANPQFNMDVAGTAAFRPIIYDSGNTEKACQGGTGGTPTACTPTTQTANTTVYGVGTTWPASIVGGQIVWSDGTSDTITARTSNTQLTVGTSRFHTAGLFRVLAPGVQIDSSGNLNVGTANETANADISGTLTVETLNSGGTTSLCIDGSNVLATCSGGASNGTSVTSTTNSTATSTIATDALGYYLSSADTTGACTAGSKTFNITGLSNTEGNYAYISSTIADTGCNTAVAMTATIQINGATVSTVSVTGSVGSNASASENYIIMYLNGSWRIIGYGNDTGNAGTTNDTADFAEWIHYNGDIAPESGELLVVDDSGNSVRTSSSTYDKHLLGVVSTSPYQVGGADDGHSVILALTGRVPVKVSLENGAVQAGDPLTSSSIPGVAMKATSAGKIIGTALEAYDGLSGNDRIMVQLHTGFNDPDAGTGLLQGNQTATGSLSVAGSTALQGGLVVTGGNTTMSSTLIDGNLTVSGDISVNGTANISNLIVQSGSVNGDFNVHGSTIADLLKVNGLSILDSLVVTGHSSLATLGVNGLATFNNDFKLAAQVNTRQATLKTFKASKSIAAGSVVILDDSLGSEGKVTTTTTNEDSRIIGVAVTTANPGEDIDVAIGGWVQVQVDTTPDAYGNAPAPLNVGQLLTTCSAEGKVHATATPTAGTILGKTTSTQDANNLVWVLITLQ